MNREFDLVGLLEPEVAPPDIAVVERQRAVLAARIAKDDYSKPRSRRGRRLLARSVAATCIAVGIGGSAAFAVSRLAPDANHGKTVERHQQDAVAVHRPGWRPELDAEHIVCDFRGLSLATTSVYTYASHFPITQTLTAARLAQECRSGTDATAAGLRDSAPVSLCAVMPPGERLAVPVVSFTPDGCRAPLAPAPISLLDERNRMRRDEVAILAVPEACPTASQAETWVHQQLERTGAALSLLPIDADSTGRCYLPHVHWGRGVVEIVANVEPGSPGTASPTSVPQTSP